MDHAASNHVPGLLNSVLSVRTLARQGAGCDSREGRSETGYEGGRADSAPWNAESGIGRVYGQARGATPVGVPEEHGAQRTADGALTEGCTERKTAVYVNEGECVHNFTLAHGCTHAEDPESPVLRLSRQNESVVQQSCSFRRDEVAAFGRGFESGEGKGECETENERVGREVSSGLRDCQLAGLFVKSLVSASLVWVLDSYRCLSRVEIVALNTLKGPE
ncbi:hypothetical protein BDV93DRAFT_516013 [Ceratobasidium sp. AG-I]|nr:hypothetical protein BDV93DRAFT_516013 [Ceratobasidium sp. AG-I]